MESTSSIREAPEQGSPRRGAHSSITPKQLHGAVTRSMIAGVPVPNRRLQSVERIRFMDKSALALQAFSCYSCVVSLWDYRSCPVMPRRFARRFFLRIALAFGSCRLCE
jgi:hypothetical protein